MAAQRRLPHRAVLDRVPGLRAQVVKAQALKPRPSKTPSLRMPSVRMPSLRAPSVRIPTVDELKLRAAQLSPETLLTFGIVAAAMIFVFLQLQPSLIFADTIPAGGDMGAQVWGPDYMREHLLPNFRLTGWSPDWYSGFPAFHFYFPLPALMIVLLDLVLPYGVAFKLIAVSGLVTLPLAAYAFGRLAGMRFPGPVLLSVATLPCLFDGDLDPTDRVHVDHRGEPERTHIGMTGTRRDRSLNSSCVITSCQKSMPAARASSTPCSATSSSHPSP